MALAGLSLFAGGCGRKEKRAPEPASSTTSTPAAPETAPGSRPSVGDAPAAPSQSLEDLLKRERTPAVDLDLGNAYWARGAMDSAAVHYRRAAEGNPKDPAGWNYLGIALMRLERFRDADDAFQHALSADAFLLETHINYGNLHFRREDWPGAVREYEVAVNIDSTAAKAWLNMGLAYEKLKNADKAGRSYRKAAKFDDSNPLPWELLGNLYYGLKLYKAAKESWAEAVRRDPSRQDLADNISRVQTWMDTALAKP